MAWEVDYDAVKDACNTLKVKKPVKFRLQKNLHCCGIYRWEDLHKIIIKRTLSRIEANKTIWHELTHAAQHERYGVSLADKIYDIDLQKRGIVAKKNDSGWEYDSIPFEAEAIAVENKFCNIWLIKW